MIRGNRGGVKIAVLACAFLGVGGLGLTSPAGASTSNSSNNGSSTGTVVSAEQTPYGKVVAVGSGPFAGYSLYLFTRDRLPKVACTTQTVTAVKLSCTGAETDNSADWPALTTDGKPVSGSGVKTRLLGSIYRSDLDARQVTYAGHPLYLFDPKPHEFGGENFVETVLPLPPWQGFWYLVSAKTGVPAPAQATITSQTLTSGKKVIAAVMVPAMGGIAITTYSYGNDPSRQSTCTGSCALTWSPVLTSGTPKTTGGVPSKDVGVIARPDGTRQVTFKGKPLYFYSREIPRLDSAGNPLNPATSGNGNGVKAPRGFGGTFSVVPAPSS
jgi:predicted lipoprotein with Yx(FWY)xxD motif